MMISGPLPKISLAAACLLLPVTAAAQTKPPAPSSGAVDQAAGKASVPIADVFAGVGLWSEDGNTLVGFDLAGALRLGRSFAVVGDFGFYEGDAAHSVKVAEAIIETLQSTRQNVLIQKFVAESKGRDIRAIVVGDRVVAAMRRVAQGQEFRSNVHAHSHA